jgi:Cd2+/Zn2+-exporting ATPase
MFKLQDGQSMRGSMAVRSFKRLRFFSAFQQHPEALAAIVCSLLTLLGGLLLYWNWIGLAVLVLAIAYGVGGYDSAREGLTTLVQEKELDVDLLMIVAALGAAGLGLWRREYHLIIDGAILILIFCISGALESYAMQRTERSIRGLMTLTPETARRIETGQEKVVAVSALKLGDRFLVKPGELIPTDGRVVEGESTVNQAAITGESIPVEKSLGDSVYGGTLNGSGALIVELDQPPESSLLQRVIRMVEAAQTETPPSQQFIEQFERGYARVIVVVGILLATLPPLLWNWNWETTIYRALVFLVVASPCALMAAIMPALLSGIANGAKQGILFKNGAQLETVGQVKAVAFDKTGTLTTGKLQVIDLITAPGQSEVELLQVAAALESRSEHPIGAAVVEFARQQSIDWSEASQVQAQIGQGISGMLNQKSAWVGKAEFVLPCAKNDIALLIEQANQWEAAGRTVIWVAVEATVLGIIAVADTIRPEAQQTVTALKRIGVKKVILLTGDNERTANQIAQALGIDQVYANLLPEDKVEQIKKLQQRYGTVAMIGDGINDAPALAQASVGIAMGAAGSDIAMETADIVLMTDRLEKLTTAIQLGQRSQRVIKQNIVFALSFIVLLLIANFTSQISLPLGVIGHEGSTVLVTLSGLRLLR